MVQLSLSTEQCRALLVFLGRTQLSGTEAPAFMELVARIQGAAEIKGGDPNPI